MHLDNPICYKTVCTMEEFYIYKGCPASTVQIFWFCSPNQNKQITKIKCVLSPSLFSATECYINSYNIP